jgi:hypothetical protein
MVYTGSELTGEEFITVGVFGIDNDAVISKKITGYIKAAGRDICR